MTTGETIAAIRFWLDQYDSWFNDDEVVLALNRAVDEHVGSRYEAGLSTERDEADLLGLLPLPYTSPTPGNRLVLTAQPIRYVLAVTVQYKGEDGGLSTERAVRPVRADRLATSKFSLFHRPTDTFPLYQRSVDDSGAIVVDVLSSSVPDTIRVYYLKTPMVHSEARLDAIWNEFGSTVREQIIQSAKTKLLAAKLPDYQAQVSVEQPMAAAGSTNTMYASNQ